MRWTPGDRGNIDDYRGRSGMGMRAAPLGIGGLVLILLLSWFTGVDFLSLVGGGGSPAGPGPSASVGTSGAAADASPEEAHLRDLVDNVTEDAQNTWRELLGGRYEDTRVALFRDAIDSACGFAQAATGPFYCPADRRVYIDLGFFDELQRRFRAPGDFAQAYVVAHELGHHVQTITGIEGQVRQRQSGDPSQRNALSVRLELQADCFAGIWGHYANQPGRQAAGGVELDPNDIDEALNAAAAIGDDRLQRQSSGRVSPESFTHGSSQQRVEWFRRGFESGDPKTCDTFKGV
ncbi:MAG TPA: neutral zinc metallopeptidase [Vicinamibacterales bacterium]